MPTGKDNSRKQPYKREQWIAAKREGRPKQVWVMEGVLGKPETITGHWEKVK
jgi:hypothetical protein